MASSFVIGDHFEKFIDGLIESGQYASRSEVVREALSALEERDRPIKSAMDEIQAAFEEGEASGGYLSLEETIAELRANLDSKPNLAAE